MSIALFDAFDAALDEAIRDSGPAPTVIVIDAEGSAFCAGFDLEACASDRAMAARLVDRLGALTQRLRAAPCVVIASVGGPALAGGCALVAACDIVIASDSARFGYPVHRLGISPAVSMPIVARALVGGRARALALSGEIVSASDAKRRGLVYSVTDDASLAPSTEALARTIAAHGPEALRATKAWINTLDHSTDALSAGAATHASMSTANSDDARERIAAFWSKSRSR